MAVSARLSVRRSEDGLPLDYGPHVRLDIRTDGFAWSGTVDELASQLRSFSIASEVSGRNEGRT